MTDIRRLIQAVKDTGATLLADPPDLVIRPADVVPPTLKAELVEHKPELLQVLSDDLMRRLSHAKADGQPVLAIALDRESGMPLLLFSEETLHAVESASCASIHRQFIDIVLSPEQRRSIERDLDFLDATS